MNSNIPPICRQEGYQSAKDFFHLMKEKHGHFDTGKVARAGNLVHWQDDLEKYLADRFGKKAVDQAKAQGCWYTDVVSIGGLFRT